MAIHYDKKSNRFRDSHGHFASKTSGLKSSIARNEYREATRPQPKEQTRNYDLEDKEFFGGEHETLEFDTEFDLWDNLEDILNEYDDPDITESKS